MAQLMGFIIGGLLLLGAGVGIGYWLALGGRQRGKADAVQAEFDAYRRQVGSHFEQTAEHFQTIGREYRALYDHMASGAEQLCETRATEERLSFDPRPGPTPPAADESATADSTEEDADTGDDQLANREAEAVAESDQAGSDDDSTPETRARNAGGESAPAEDQDEYSEGGESVEAASSPDESSDESPESPADDAESDQKADQKADKKNRPESSCEDGEEKSAEGAADTPPAEGSVDDKDRIYH